MSENQKWFVGKTQKGEEKYSTKYNNKYVNYGVVSFKNGKKVVWISYDKKLLVEHNVRYNVDEQILRSDILNYIDSINNSNL